MQLRLTNPQHPEETTEDKKRHLQKRQTQNQTVIDPTTYKRSGQSLHKIHSVAVVVSVCV